jgi:hypothetical protein
MMPMSPRRAYTPLKTRRPASAMALSTPSPSNRPAPPPRPERSRYRPQPNLEEIRQAHEAHLTELLNPKYRWDYLPRIEKFPIDDIIESLHRQNNEDLLDKTSSYNPVAKLITELEKLTNKQKANDIMHLLPGFLIECSNKFERLNDQLTFVLDRIFHIYRLGNAASNHRQQALQFQFCLGIPKNIYQFFFKRLSVEDKQTYAGLDIESLTAKIAFYLCTIVQQQLMHPNFAKLPDQQQENIKAIYREARFCEFITHGLIPKDNYSALPLTGSPTFLDWINADSRNIPARVEMTRRICEYWYTKPPVLDLSGCGVNQLPDDISWAQILRLKEGYDNHSCLPSEDEEVRSLFTNERHLINLIDLRGNPLERLPWWVNEVRFNCQIRWDKNPWGDYRLDPRFYTPYPQD